MGDWCLGHGPLGMGSDINAAQRQVNSVSHGSMVLESVLSTLQGVQPSSLTQRLGKNWILPVLPSASA